MNDDIVSGGGGSLGGGRGNEDGGGGVSGGNVGGGDGSSGGGGWDEDGGYDHGMKKGTVITLVTYATGGALLYEHLDINHSISLVFQESHDHPLGIMKFYRNFK